MKRFNIIIVGFLFFLGTCEATLAQVPSSIQKLIKHRAFKNGQLSISVIEAESGDEIVDYQSDVALIPASSLKVITTFTALHYLSPSYKYKTSIYTIGKLDADGMLHGDLRVVGSGDPTLGSPEESVPSIDAIFDRIYRGLVKRGVTCISGDISVDASIFDQWAIHDTWSWDDLCNYYASGAYGLNVHENFYKLNFERSINSNTATQIHSIVPNIRDLEITNRVTTGGKGSGDNAYLYGDPYTHKRMSRGTIPPGRGTFGIKGAIPNPPLYFVQSLRDYLASKGIQSKSATIVDSSKNHGDSHLLFRVVSPELSDIIRRANYESNNLYCESLLRTIGSLKHQPAGFEDGLDQVKLYMKSLGLSEEELQMRDGSGLSAFNRVTTKLMSSFLAEQIRTLGLDTVTDLLPLTGSNGTVKGMLQNMPSQGAVWLKSGSISGVLSYTGVIQTKSGKALTICLISNGHTARNTVLRSQIENILNTLYLQN